MYLIYPSIFVLNTFFNVYSKIFISLFIYYFHQSFYLLRTLIFVFTTSIDFCVYYVRQSLVETRTDTRRWRNTLYFCLSFLLWFCFIFICRVFSFCYFFFFIPIQSYAVKSSMLRNINIYSVPFLGTMRRIVDLWPMFFEAKHL